MITTDDWVKKCENVKNFEEHFIGSQCQVEDAVESFIINLGMDSEDEDSFSDHTDDSSEDSDNSDDGDIVSGIQRLA